MKDNRPSLTALMVAIAVLVFGGDEHGRSRLPPGNVEAQIAILSGAGFFVGRFPWLFCNSILTMFMRLMESLASRRQGLIKGLADRKCWLEDQLVQSIQHRGATQVVILGAGYCTMSLRLAPHNEQVTFWEIDHPATSAMKQKSLQAIGCPSNLHLLAVDLSVKKLPDILPQLPTYDPSKPTTVIMEGLIYYLSESNIKDLLKDIDTVTGPGSVLAFDYFPRNDQGQHGNTQPSLGRYTKIMYFLVNCVGEELKFGVNPEDLPRFLTGTPWERMDTWTPDSVEKLAILQKKKSS